MRQAAFLRRSAAVIAAAALHAVVLALVIAGLAPRIAAEPPAMQVTLLQRPPPQAKPSPRATPSAIKTSRAVARAPAARVDEDAARQAPPAAEWRVRPEQGREADGVRTTLRGKLGCRSADLLALTKAERAACEDRLAKGVENAPAYAVISPKLKKVFDKTFECPKGDVWCEYRTGKGPYPGLFAPHGKTRDPSWDQD